MSRLVFAGVLFASVLASAPASAGAPVVAPLVSQDSSPQFQQVKAAEEEAAAPADERTFFSFLPPSDLKPLLNQKKPVLILLGLFGNMYGANILGPIALTEVALDMDWVLPALVWMGVEWAWFGFCLPGLWVYGIGAIPMFVGRLLIAWTGTMTTLANLNRESVWVGELGNEQPKRKRHAPAETED